MAICFTLQLTALLLGVSEVSLRALADRLVVVDPAEGPVGAGVVLGAGVDAEAVAAGGVLRALVVGVAPDGNGLWRRWQNWK